MGLFDIFKRPSAETLAQKAARQQRAAEIKEFINNMTVPPAVKAA